MNVALQYLPRLLLSEAVLRRRWLVGGFVLISLGFVGVGLVWPKVYTASATVYVEDSSIIQPLMAGTAVATTVKDRARVAREVIFSRKILLQILKDMGWLATKPSKLDQERLMDGIKKRTRVTNVGSNLVNIEYHGGNPERVFKTAQRFADLLMHESAVNQKRESTDAFEFIDGQAKIYHAKLTEAEQALKTFRSQHLDARPGTEKEVTAKITTLQEAIEKTTLALKEANIKRGALEKQLSGEAVLTTTLTREGQYVAQIADLQTKLDTLRLSYHDTYPDIVRLKHQINELRELVDNERKKRENASNAIKTGDPYAVDETVRVSPIYQKLRTEWLDTKTNIQTLNTRLHEMRQMLTTEEARANKLYSGEATLAELTRDYEVNRDIYHDLLKRRENARVSKNLDANKQGLTMRIQEPAVLPLEPTSARFIDFVAAGLLLGLVVPIGVLFALQHIDPRVRVPAVITERTGVPVLAVVPRMLLMSDVARLDRSLGRSFALVLVTIVVVGTIGTLKFTGRL